MKVQEFNLLREPWIRVMKPDCTEQEVSLLTMFENAHEYRSLSGEMAHQDVAVQRLLLAILHTVFTRYDSDGVQNPVESPRDALKRWKSIWEGKKFPMNVISSYLNAWENRFWLFDEKRPFYQIPDIEGTFYNAAKLNGILSESADKLRLFTQLGGREKLELSYAQAARWLLTMNCYDDTSAKPKKENKGDKFPSVGAGWVGRTGTVMAEGSNLFETLMLNLTMLRDGKAVWPQDRPVWELDYPRTEQRTQIAAPDNLAELLTLQSRRLFLKRDEGKVTGVYLLGGDFFEKQEAGAEQYTVWAYRQDKKTKLPYYEPVRHDPSRQIWRDFPRLFLDAENEKRPGVVEWVSRLTKAKILEKNLIQFRITGILYGNNNSMISNVFSDRISLQVDLLSEKGLGVCSRIEEERRKCEMVAVKLKKLHQDILLSRGKNPVKLNPLKGLDELFYERCDYPYSMWIQNLKADMIGQTLENECLKWERCGLKIAMEIAKEMVLEAGPQALVGRIVTFKKKNGKVEEKRYYSASYSYYRFASEVRKIYEKTKKEQEDVKRVNNI